jgi:hypothetical protein
MKSLTSNISLILTMALLGAFFYALWVFYIPLLDNYFYGDDTQIIWFAAANSIGQILFSPEHYRAMSGGLFQPMLGLSFKIDWMMFKMAPEGYYVHNLLAVMLAGAALFIFLRTYTNSLIALVGSVLFSLNPVVFSIFSYCTNRHYMEGMAFALLSLYFFVRSERKGKISVLSIFFYLIASLYKEVYVLLPAVALIVSGGNLLQRFKSTLFLWAVLFLYIVWRFWMIRGIGGYPFYDIWELKNLTAGISRLLEIMPFHFFGSYHILFWAVIAVIIITVNRKMDILKSGTILIILLIPTLPVLRLFDRDVAWSRYIFHLSVFLIFIGIIWGRENVVRRGWRSIAVISVLITVLTLSIIRDYELRTSFRDEMKVNKETAEEFLYSGKEYIKEKQPAWFYEGLRDINEYFYGKKIDTKIIPENDLTDYMSGERRREIISLGYDIRPRPGKELKRNVIKGKIAMSGYRMNWGFGPYKTGYFIIGGSYQGLYTTIMPLKSRGEYLFGKHYPDGRPVTNFMRIVYRSPEGWEGITDEFEMKIPGNYTIPLQ